MKTNTVYQIAYNDCLDHVAGRDIGDDLGSENELAQKFGVSRTTVRAILQTSRTAGLITASAPAKTIARLPVPEDYFPLPAIAPVTPAMPSIESQIMRWLCGGLRPGQAIRLRDLVRRFDAPLKSVLAQLLRFEHLGLLRHSRNGDWIVEPVAPEFANDLADMRDIFELRAARAFITLDRKSAAWEKLDQIESAHRALRADPALSEAEFAALDERLHRLILEATPNSLMASLYTWFAVVFHYPDATPAPRAQIHDAIIEHLAYIAALKSRDVEVVKTALQLHLHSARKTSPANPLFRLPAPASDAAAPLRNA